jgi:hypothetical protein
MQLSVYRNSGGLQAIMNSKLRKLAERDEEVVLASGIPSTIIRSASLQTTPGGERGFSFTEVPAQNASPIMLCTYAALLAGRKTVTKKAEVQ